MRSYNWKRLNLTAVLWDFAATIMILLENHGVLQPIMVIYSVPSLNIHARVNLNTRIMSHAQVNILRKLKVIPGLSQMSFIRHGRIVRLRLIEVSSRVRLGISGN